MENILDPQEYTCILANIQNKVMHIRLNRPHAKNAINQTMINELGDLLQHAYQDKDVHVVVLDGGTDVFSVGADLKEIQTYSTKTAIEQDFLNTWTALANFKKPIIACVSGYALGGGCELALMCDMVIASSEANFAQPEVKIGLMPGAGATQYLTNVLGKAQAMDMCLTGKLITAFEALNMGLVSRVSAPQDLWQDAMNMALDIAKNSLSAVIDVKKSIKAHFEMSLYQGLEQERTLFYQRLNHTDAKEGIAAFIEKRPAIFTHD
jgi:enoyl-CoA hydratase